MSEPHKHILQAFSSVWSDDLDQDQIGRLLVSVSYCLGRAIAELNRRGVPYEVIDKNIKSAVLRGVDKNEENDG